MPSPRSAIRACLYVSEDLVYSPDFPSPHSVHTTADDGNHMVHMARGDLSGDRISAPETKEATTMGTNRHRSEVPYPPVQSYGAAKEKCWNSNSILSTSVETDWTTGESPVATSIPNKLAYLKYYAIDIGRATLNLKETALLYPSRNGGSGKRIPGIRVVQRRPTTKCTHIWHNLHNTWITEQMKSTWFTAIHELIRTNKRFATIRLTATDRFCQ